jgi:hypothetical protein
VHNHKVFTKAIQLVSASVSQYGHRMRVLRIDAGKVENSEEAAIFLNQSLQIRMEPAAPECQFQNPVERHVQTVQKGVGSMFVRQNNLGDEFWGLALSMFVQARNVCPNKISGEFSPWYFMTGKHPDVPRRFKFYFGEPVVSVILRAQVDSFTFTPYGEFGYAVGSIESTSGATLVYIPSRSGTRVYHRLDVRRLNTDYSPSKSGSPLEVLDGSVALPIGMTKDNCGVFDLNGSQIITKDSVPDEELHTRLHDMVSNEPALWEQGHDSAITAEEEEE